MLQTKTRKRYVEKWPKEIDYYLHSSKEDNYWQGQELKLNEKALDDFRYIGYEVTFRLAINEDGTNKVLAINGIDVSDRGITI